MNIRKLTQYLHSADILVIGFLALLTLLNVVFATRIPNWWLMVAINIAVTGFICWLGFARHSCGSRIIRVIHDWYVAPTVFLSFKEIYFMIKPMHFGRDYDDVLIAIDRWIFGVDPTRWLMQFANPWLTEILQLAYTLFYVLFLILGYELYRRHNLDLFHYFMFTCVYGFFLSYLGYFTLPAIGPRFTLHDFMALDNDLPGVLLTPYMRWFVNAGESVVMNVSNEVAIASTQRDVFPSGHTMMTLVLMYLSGKYKARYRHFIYVTGMLLIIATVYQRYHYVIDLAGGALFMVFCVLTSPRLYAFTKYKLGTLESRFTAAGREQPVEVQRAANGTNGM
ncbi:phosphatase PAP2 family protein [bacterium]|nr:MAG: phosphatase PAP2 family protein [bacterium]